MVEKALFVENQEMHPFNLFVSKASFIAMVFFSLALGAAPIFSNPLPCTGTLIRVFDGDSFLVQCNSVLNVRLAEIDAPETKKNSEKKSCFAQPGGEEAKRYTQQFLTAGPFQIIEMGKDNYGRTVARIYRNETSLSHALVKQGLVTVYSRYVQDPELFKLQAQAKKNKLGIWSLPNKCRIESETWRHWSKTQRCAFKNMNCIIK